MEELGALVVLLVVVVGGVAEGVLEFVAESRHLQFIDLQRLLKGVNVGNANELLASIFLVLRRRTFSETLVQLRLAWAHFLREDAHSDFFVVVWQSIHRQVPR